MLKLLPQILKIFLTLLVPLVIVLGVVRLVAIEPYLAFEYSKPDFPKDPFGFARDQRLDHAAANLQFVTQNQPLANLAEQDHNGNPLYNARELKHMQDVQNVYQVAWRVWQIALALAVFIGLVLAWRKENRPAFASAIRSGGALTVGIVVVIGLAAIVAWQGWFVIFHQMFFAAGSWTFNYSDTLIRLFPEKFWYDTALTITNLSPFIGFLVFWIGSRLLKNYNQGTGSSFNLTPTM
jgi:integral membrane protein (TIGR01906 family)